MNQWTLVHPSWRKRKLWSIKKTKETRNATNQQQTNNRRNATKQKKKKKPATNQKKPIKRKSNQKPEANQSKTNKPINRNQNPIKTRINRKPINRKPRNQKPKSIAETRIKPIENLETQSKDETRRKSKEESNRKRRIQSKETKRKQSKSSSEETRRMKTQLEVIEWKINYGLMESQEKRRRKKNNQLKVNYGLMKSLKINWKKKKPEGWRRKWNQLKEKINYGSGKIEEKARESKSDTMLSFGYFSLLFHKTIKSIYIHDQSNNWAKVKTKPIKQNTSKLNVNCSTIY